MFLNNKKLLKEAIAHTKELNWANIYHDSIRGHQCLLDLPLNIGRWAGSYSFFYVLNRILRDYKPSSILELGLGESTKFIATYIANYLPQSQHVVVEHDTTWITVFQNNFKLSHASKIQQCDLEETSVNKFKTIGYAKLGTVIPQKIDLYVIDGPFGSDRYSRHNIVDLVQKFDNSEEFIILLDDYERKGEKDTADAIIATLKSKNLVFFSEKYSGVKSQLVIVSEKYKYATSF